MLKKYPANIAGIKDSSGDWENTKALLSNFAADGFHVLVEVVEELGADAFVYGKPADPTVKFANASDEGAQVIVRWDPKNPPEPGTTISVVANPSSIHLFDAATGERLK